MKSTDAVTAYRENLPPGDLIDFPYRRLDRLGIPAYSTAFWPEEGSFCNGLGYGTSEAEAMTSAFGELFESVAAGDKLPLMPRVHGTYDELVRHYGDDGVLDPVESCLDAGTAYDHDRVLDWVEARRFPGGRPYSCPWSSRRRGLRTSCPQSKNASGCLPRSPTASAPARAWSTPSPTPCSSWFSATATPSITGPWIGASRWTSRPRIPRRETSWRTSMRRASRSSSSWPRRISGWPTFTWSATTATRKTPPTRSP